MADNFQQIDSLKRATIVIGYYIPNKPPEFLGTGFLIGNGDRALTCAHVVCFNRDGNKSRSLPLKKKVDDKLAELSCWAFTTKEDHHFIVKMRITNIAIFTDPHIEAYYVGGSPDVAYLILDRDDWKDKFDKSHLPSLKVSNTICREIGKDVVILGYPSTKLLMTDKESGKPKCMEPIAQFTKLAGVLPFSKAPLPQFLAFDTMVVGGSSGSPIIDLSNNRVIAMVSQYHPFRLDSINPTYGPSSISFGVPSNFFYELSLSRTGIGKFNFNDNIVKNE